MASINALEIVGLVASLLLAILQPVALILVYIPYKSTALDQMATIDVAVSYMLGLLTFIYSAVTVGKLANKENNGEETRYFFFASAIVFGLLGIPTLVFNLIELFTNISMFHHHIDMITAIILSVDIILGLTSTLILGFGFQPLKEKKRYTKV